MKRTLVLFFALLLISAAASTAQTSDSDILLQRIAAQGGGTAEVFVDKLPPTMPKVPLPEAQLIGSVHQSIESPLTVDSFDLYYNAKPDTLETYGSAMIAAGWKEHPLSPGSGGFVSSAGPTTRIYCKPRGAFVTARIGQDPIDLRVSISPPGDASEFVCGRNPVTALMHAFAQGHLPSLHAPAGVRMSVSLIPSPGTQSAAYIHNGTSAGALVADFAAQMSNARWKAGPKSTGDGIASQTFVKIEGTTPWQCTISVQAVSNTSGEFVAFIDAADITALAKGSSTLFSH